MTALDDYGQSVQLWHAMESASRLGTPVLACMCCANDDNNEGESDEEKMEDAILVCSLQRPRPGVIVPRPPRGGVVSMPSCGGREGKSPVFKAHPSIRGMVRPLATRDNVGRVPGHGLHLAMVTTGLRPDAEFLPNRLRSHLSNYWLRYDRLPPPDSPLLPKMARDMLLDFMG